MLEAFTSDSPELVLADIARRAGLDNATTFRLLSTFVALSYIEKVPGSRAFRLTLKCLDLGFNAIARADIRTLARPVLRNLVGELNEAASIGVLEGADILYIERVQAGLTRLGVDVRIGTRVPAYGTAIGHAILAFLPNTTQIRVLQARPRQKITERTPTDLTALLDRLREVHIRGYAVSDQESVPGLRILAAPIFDLDRVPLAAVSVASPAMGLSAPDFEQAARVPLLDAANKLSRALQASGGLAPASA